MLVTHGMQFLKQCDRVIFLKNGSVEEEGTHEELMEQKVGCGLHTVEDVILFVVKQPGRLVRQHGHV